MSVRPIDADALKEHVQSYAGMFTDEGFMVNLEAILRGVDFQPTLGDLRPKGRWEPVDARYSRCTNCKKERNVRAQIAWTFCPSCGADMRGGGEDA